VQRASSWWIGDLLVFAGKRYGETYVAAQDATGYKLQTLKNFAWVARKCPPSMRRPELSWRAHKIVASRPDNERRRWLDRAVREEWTSAKLALAVQDTPPDEPRLAALADLPANGVADFDPTAHWAGMPGYEPAPKPFQVVVSCESEADREAFMERIGASAVTAKNGRTWSMWWPEKRRAAPTVEWREAA
jgi:hypothetical protein